MNLADPPAGTILDPPVWLEIVGPCTPLSSVPENDPVFERVVRLRLLGNPAADAALALLDHIRPIAQESTERN